MTKDGGVVKVEPMRNFPIISDLVVDMGDLFSKMDAKEDNNKQTSDDLNQPARGAFISLGERWW